LPTGRHYETVAKGLGKSKLWTAAIDAKFGTSPCEKCTRVATPAEPTGTPTTAYPSVKGGTVALGLGLSGR
jgi:hypothetical protein